VAVSVVVAGEATTSFVSPSTIALVVVFSSTDVPSFDDADDSGVGAFFFFLTDNGFGSCVFIIKDIRMMNFNIEPGYTMMDKNVLTRTLRRFCSVGINTVPPGNFDAVYWYFT
jgi:hypothetical protein